ncbi:creatine transporter [Metarhizium album ARSEF 1941]|uniref:Creatine transporter n=1 Tax=Metarhizium album (strain ARSEF 1941) TaxID=1081103 RepID=A0A0B2WHI5_METAS|nr:creatine transporter [Metarhizium album ARSEF 1941]KHN95486.1 creatine transporter [Metarhizium album ARSEF 1941]
MPSTLKTIFKFLAPDSEKGRDGRDVWSSRTSFVLAAMGGAVGLGNLLRYPSVVFSNSGVQWFIPYFLALLLLGIPLLLLEISIGLAYRGGPVVAYNAISKHTRGVGFAVTMTGYIVATYYVPILSWVMHYFRSSFQRPLPWTGRGDEFYMQDVVANAAPVPGTVSGGTVTSYTMYPGVGFVGETVGWCAFVWLAVYLCLFKGVGVTGRAVYFTMGLPIIVMFVLMGRSLSLPNAIDGVRLYFAEWHGEKLASGQIWQAACGQIFFSIGVGFGYFTAYASYSSRYSNAVQDTIIISLSNSLYEILAGFAVFGIVGFLGLRPQDNVQLTTFSVGFLTYPLAISETPGANVWAVLFFLTLAFLGLSSAFALTESMVTLLCDSDLGKRLPRVVISTAVIVITFLLSLLYCSRFGFYLLDAMDTWINNLALLFAAWCEGMVCTTLYRHRDVYKQVGWAAFLTYTGCYLMAMVLGVATGHSVGPSAGAGVGFGLFVVGTAISVLVAKTPDSVPPTFWGKNKWLSRFWWVAFYPGNQLTRDLNSVIATGKNWSIPFIWAPVVRYISCPILSIIISFAYPAFFETRMDPLHIFAFAVAHVTMVIVAVGFIFPPAFDVFIPPKRRGNENTAYAPQVTIMGVSDGSAVTETEEARDETKPRLEQQGVGGQQAQ